MTNDEPIDGRKTRWLALDDPLRRARRICVTKNGVALPGLAIERCCEECGRSFIARMTTVRAGGGRFCSKSCSSRMKHRRNPFGGCSHQLTPEERRLAGQRGGAATAAKFAALPPRTPWHLRFPERKKAQGAVGDALRRGHLHRPEFCTACGASGRLHAHHDDYSQRLNVRWLCVSCHYAFHHPTIEATS